jgi:hypothetical protein
MTDGLATVDLMNALLDPAPRARPEDPADWIARPAPSAETLLREHIEVCRRTLGAEAEDTLAAIGTLANVLQVRGDLDGAEIHVDFAEDIESALFIIAHLFGHTVQWNTDEAAREIGYQLYPNPGEEMMRRLHDYEHEACRYSMQLFHEAGVNDLDQWLSDYSACDFAFLGHFYRSGEKPPFKTFPTPPSANGWRPMARF